VCHAQPGADFGHILSRARGTPVYPSELAPHRGVSFSFWTTRRMALLGSEGEIVVRIDASQPTPMAMMNCANDASRQRSRSLGEVINTHVQPVSLYTRVSDAPGSP
jgi:hypothetical protein